MSDEESATRGERALQQYTELTAAFDAVENALLRTLGQTPVGQDAKVLKLHMAVQNLAAVKQAMREVIDDGRMASAALAIAGLTRPN